LISEATFVVTDTETTGEARGRDRMIEIGAVRVSGGETHGRYSALVNPGVSVPRRITRLTGISTAMIFDKPSPEPVLRAFLEFLGDGVLVAHNLRFDARVIDQELRRYNLRALSNRTLCTLRLARRLLPGLRSKGLSSVADFYGLTFERRHRALSDAEVTARILVRLLEKLSLEHRIDELDEVLAFQNRSYGGARPSLKRIRELRDRVVPALPSRAGVYLMKDAAGRVLYVGKAKDLRSRVGSYFSGVEGHDAKTRQLLDAVRNVEWRSTPTELAALLLESRLIKQIRPRFNRAGVRYARRPFLRLSTSEAFPRLSYCHELRDDGSEYYGPVRGEGYAGWVVDLVNRMFLLRECDDATLAHGARCIIGDLGRCSMPCEGLVDVDDYAPHVERVRRFLRGETPDVLDALRVRMERAAGEMDFEQARVYRDFIRRLEGTMARHRVLAMPVLDKNALVVVNEPKQALEVLVVRNGLPAHSEVLREPAGSEAIWARIRALVARHFESGGHRPEHLSRSETEEIALLSSWLFANRQHLSIHVWSEGCAGDELADAVVSAIRTSDCDVAVPAAADA
jgi:DNA polymerase-3 subunit epsilon